MVSHSHFSYGIMPTQCPHAGGYPKKLQVPEGFTHVPTTQVARAHLKTIMSNPESRRIFYFLMLNLAYMMIQMLYGIWTNSLGLISDGMWVKVAVSSHVNIKPRSHPHGL